MRDLTSPTARALRVLELVQTRPGVTAGELAAELGVTERAVRRYVGILREAEIPVESTRGRHGGYRVGPGIRLPPLVFGAAEALGLVMAALDGDHGAADDEDLGGAALGKIIRALPENVGRQAAVVRRHASAARTRRPARPSPETTTALVAAVAAGRRVRLGYRSDGGREWEEDVDPWAVVVRHGRWYLLCHSHRAEAVRAYRIDRVLSVVERAERADVPEDADFVRVLEEHLGVGWEFETTVVFDAPYDEVARYVTAPMGRLSRLDDTQCVLEGTTGNPAMYAGEWLSAIPVAFHVEGGDELRAAVAAVAARLAASLERPSRADPRPARRSVRRTRASRGA